MLVGVEHITTRGLPEAQKVDIVRKALPGLTAKKVSEAVPGGFELTQVVFTGEFSAKPFGVGLSGSIAVQFEKQKPGGGS